MKDIYKFDMYLQRKMERIRTDPELSEGNRELILRYLKESQLGKTVRKGQKREIGPGRNLQTAGYLTMMAKDWFKKDLDKVTQEDMEKFVMELNTGVITTSRRNPGHKETPYSDGTKSNIKKFVRKFYKWLLEDNKRFPDLVEWIDTSQKETEVEAIKGLNKGVWEIVEIIPVLNKKALVWATFDSGFREGEIINCDIRDLEQREDGIFYLTCRESKTKPRTVSLPLSSELVGRWLEKHPDKDNPDANLWQTSRRQFYKTVKLYGRKAHNANITVHMLRHTSATYYAPRLDRTTFCKKFGWSYASKSPDRYIDFAKVSQSKVIEVVKSEKYGNLKEDFDQLKLANNIMRENMEKLTKRLQHYEQEGPIMDRAISGDKDLMDKVKAAVLEELKKEAAATQT